MVASHKKSLARRGTRSCSRSWTWNMPTHSYRWIQWYKPIATSTLLGRCSGNLPVPDGVLWVNRHSSHLLTSVRQTTIRTKRYVELLRCNSYCHQRWPKGTYHISWILSEKFYVNIAKCQFLKKDTNWFVFQVFFEGSKPVKVRSTLSLN